MESDYKGYGQMGAALLLLIQNKRKWCHFPLVNDIVMQRSCLIVLYRTDHEFTFLKACFSMNKIL